MTPRALCGLLLVVLACRVGAGEGGRVLVVLPGHVKSHAVLGRSIVRILLEAGHEVTFVTPYPVKLKAPNFSQIDVSSILNDVKGLNKQDTVSLDRPPDPYAAMQRDALFTEHTLQHPEFLALLMDTDTAFDVVIAQWLYTGLLAPLADLFECPLIWYSASSVSWQNLGLVHEPSSVTYSFGLTSYDIPTPPFTLKERVYQMLLLLYDSAWNKYQTSSIEIPAYEKVYQGLLRMRGRTLQNYDALVHNASLLLLDSHATLGQNLPMPHNAKFIGGHHINMNVTLEKGLQKVLDKSKRGAIFINLGAEFKSEDIPAVVKRELIDVIGQLEQTVIWKFDEELLNVPSNLHIMRRVSQRHVLSHPNTFLFVTNGELASLIEAVHFGVPVIGAATSAEHLANVHACVVLGSGVSVKLASHFPRALKAAILEVLANNSYRAKAKAASFILRNGLVPPAQELLHWIELTMVTRGALPRSPALTLTTLERFNIDILILVLLFIWFCSKVIKVIQIHLSSSNDQTKKDS